MSTVLDALALLGRGWLAGALLLSAYLVGVVSTWIVARGFRKHDVKKAHADAWASGVEHGVKLGIRKEQHRRITASRLRLDNSSRN